MDKVKRKLESVGAIKSKLYLPDHHLKANMESISSAVYNTGDYIVPILASAAVNDGMSLIRLNAPDRGCEDELLFFLGEINKCSKKSRWSLTKYSPSITELEEVLSFGAKALITKYNLEESHLEGMELGGCMEEVATERVKALVPLWMRVLSLFRAEFGLNFRGNHFLEVQRVKAQQLNTNVDFIEDELMVMTHLGPGPLAGNLMRFIAKRKKISKVRSVFLGILKLLYFLKRKREFNLTYKAILDYFFTVDGYSSFKKNTPMGKAISDIIKMSTNYGFAYQLGTYKAIIDAWKKTCENFGIDFKQPELVWNVSHNSIYFEDKDIIVRHNSTKVYDGKPSILAGRYDHPSYLSMPSSGSVNRGLYSTHDHGVGVLLENGGEVKKLNETSTRYNFQRGNSVPYKVSTFPLILNKDVNKLLQEYRKNNMFLSYIMLYPIVTLKN